MTKTYPKDTRPLVVGDIVYRIGWVGGPGKVLAFHRDKLVIKWTGLGLKCISGPKPSIEEHGPGMIRLFEPWINKLRLDNEIKIATATGKRLERSVNLKRKIDEKFDFFEEAKKL